MSVMDEINIEKIKQFMICDAPKLPYHNSDHGLNVWRVARNYGVAEGISYNDQLALEFGALNHDLIYIIGAKDNEEQSAKLNAERLYGLEVPYDIITKSSGLILATKIPTNPKTLLEKIICDADVDNLGREDFMDKNKLIRQEFLLGGNKFTDLEWYENSLNFLENHEYYTEIAQKKRQRGKEKNVEQLRRLVRFYKSRA